MHISLWGMMGYVSWGMCLWGMCPFLMASYVKCLRMSMCLVPSWQPLMLFHHSMQSVLCLHDSTVVYTPEPEL